MSRAHSPPARGRPAEERSPRPPAPPILRVPFVGRGGDSVVDLETLPWSSAARLDLVRADGRGPAAWPTRVEVAWGSAALFVRFLCTDGRRRATLTRRDAPLWEEEVVELFLAPGAADPVVYFELDVNPLGALFDARVESPHGDRATMRVAPEWSCSGMRWQAGVAGPRQDWWAALALPWTGLGLDGAPPPRWRANFYRVERAAGDEVEHSAWAPTFAEPADFHRPRFFGHLELDAAPARQRRG